MTKVKIDVENDGYESGYAGDALIGAIRLDGGDIHGITHGVQSPQEHMDLLAELILSAFKIHGLDSTDSILRVAKKTARRKYLEQQIDRLEKELKKEIEGHGNI